MNSSLLSWHLQILSISRLLLFTTSAVVYRTPAQVKKMLTLTVVILCPLTTFEFVPTKALNSVNQIDLEPGRRPCHIEGAVQFGPHLGVDSHIPKKV